MKFIVVYDGTNSDVRSLTDEQATAINQPSYDTFGEARQACAHMLRSQRNKFNDAIRRVEALNRHTVKAFVEEAVEDAN